MKWLIDYDSVLADLGVAQVASVNAAFGTHYKKDYITSWDWWATRPKQIEDFVWGPECFKSRDWTLALPPVPGAIAGVRDLLWHDQELVVVSDRKPYMAEWIHAWLAQHGLSLPVVVTSRDAYTKLQAAKDLGLTRAIDDAPHNAVEMVASGLFGWTYLFDQPWNRDVAPQPRLARATSWEAVLDHFRTDVLGRVAELQAPPPLEFAA